VPSSLIFAGIVVLWLLILVPTVARCRQEVARPSAASLSGRVLQRPRRTREVDEVPDVDMDGADPAAKVPHLPGQREGRDVEPLAEDLADARGEPSGDEAGAARAEASVDEAGGPAPHEPPAEAPTQDTAAGGLWDYPAPRYRPGRGGFDRTAADVAAHARYAFRRRVVLALLLAAGATAAAAVLASPMLWWPHAAVDVALIGYLAHLRRQVRTEETIRDRRAARMAGARRPAAADPDLDDRVGRGRGAVGTDEHVPFGSADEDEAARNDGSGDVGEGRTAVALDVPAGASGAGQRAGADDAIGCDRRDVEPAPTLPRLRPVAPPSLPSGTAVLGVDDLAPDLPAFDRNRRDYRHAAGQ